jgi:hypothetical protein
MSNAKKKKGFWGTVFGRYVFNNLIALDQTWNARTGGDPDETISSRIGKIKRAHGGEIPWSHPLARIIDHGLEIIEKDHCINAIEEDEGKDSIVKTYERGPV